MPENRRIFGDDTDIRKSVGEQIIDGLSEFADALESGNVEQFTCHRAVLLNGERLLVSRYFITRL